MSNKTVAQETIAYLKFWLGVMVLALISLSSWVLSQFIGTLTFKLIASLIGIVIISILAYFIHKQIERLILTLRDK